MLREGRGSFHADGLKFFSLDKEKHLYGLFLLLDNFTNSPWDGKGYIPWSIAKPVSFSLPQPASSPIL